MVVQQFVCNGVSWLSNYNTCVFTVIYTITFNVSSQGSVKATGSSVNVMRSNQIRHYIEIYRAKCYEIYKPLSVSLLLFCFLRITSNSYASRFDLVVQSVLLLSAGIDSTSLPFLSD